jgi:hypothetical protein
MVCSNEKLVFIDLLVVCDICLGAVMLDEYKNYTGIFMRLGQKSSAITGPSERTPG